MHSVDLLFTPMDRPSFSLIKAVKRGFRIQPGSSSAVQESGARKASVAASPIVSACPFSRFGQAKLLVPERDSLQQERIGS